VILMPPTVKTSMTEPSRKSRKQANTPSYQECYVLLLLHNPWEDMVNSSSSSSCSGSSRSSSSSSSSSRSSSDDDDG